MISLSILPVPEIVVWYCKLLKSCSSVSRTIPTASVNQGWKKTVVRKKVFSFLGFNVRRQDSKLLPENSRRISRTCYTLFPAASFMAMCRLYGIAMNATRKATTFCFDSEFKICIFKVFFLKKPKRWAFEVFTTPFNSPAVTLY